MMFRSIFNHRIEIIVLLVLSAVFLIPIWPLIIDILGLERKWSGKGLIVALLSWLHIDSLLPTQVPWLYELIHNLFGYAAIFLPIYLISRYLHRIKYDESSKANWLSRLLRNCMFERHSTLPINSTENGECYKRSNYMSSTTSSLSTSWSKFCNPSVGTVGYMVLLLFSGIGLQVSYLTWGVLQERIMTQKYGDEHFKDSQFLVFFNRFLAAILASIIVKIQNSNSKSKSHNIAPYFKYSYASLSNILSSWCQYEALKYVSFPIQVLAKASKIIPVMLMGKLIRRQNYRLDEYLSAIIISFGVFLFLLDTSGHKSTNHNHFTNNSTQDPNLSFIHIFSGAFLLFGYMLFDSFTSNWQDRLFKTYKINSLQMMVGVNIWSCLFTFSSLLESGGLYESIDFGMKHHQFIIDAALLSICGAVGQLFIFFTISKFGAVIFIVIMTLRQAIAILLSVMLYGHPVHLLGILGVLLVFCALFARIYLSYRARK